MEKNLQESILKNNDKNENILLIIPLLDKSTWLYYLLQN